MAIKFKTKPDAIQKMIGESVVHLPVVATAFYTLASANPEGRAELADKLHKLEEEADERYVKTVRKVSETFITPNEREDIYNMMETLDDIVDCLDHAGHLIIDFNLQRLPGPFLKSATELVAMCDQARDAVGLLKKPAKLEKVFFAINTHENKLDQGYRALLREILVDGADPIHALKLITLADVVEQAATRIDDFTRTLAVAAIKET